jgi:hypothetical protein
MLKTENARAIAYDLTTDNLKDIEIIVKAVEKANI